MKTKFGKKLLALFLAAVMSLTVFTGAFTAYASTDPGYHDDDISGQINSLGWVELTDEQTCAALLDYLDEMLAEAAIPVTLYYDVVIITIDINGTIDSVSGLIDIVAQVQSLLDSYGGTIGGDVKNINLSAVSNLSYTSVSTGYPACGKDYRANNSAKDIVKALFSLLHDNVANWDGSKAVIKQVLRGELSLGIANSFVNIWDLLNDNLFKTMFEGGMPDGYENNLVFNIVTKLLTGMTDWYTEEEANNMYNQVQGYELDTMLFKALSENLLQQINVQVTYPDGTNSRDLYEQGIKDPNLCYTNDGNVYIFQYDENADGQDDVNLTLEPGSNLFEFSYEAFEVAWKTCLAPTLGLLNSAVKDYDWNYTQWYLGQGYDWNYSDVASNYADTYVEAWAASESLDLDEVKQDLTYDRSVVDDPSYNWRDIDSTKLFNELRRSPLMVYYFEAPTGPLNTNFKCTGTPNIDAFMENSYQDYTSILGGLNDFLVAAVKDFLPDFNSSVLVTTGNTTAAATIATTLVQNALKVVQYVADATDANILSSFYHNNGSEAVLTETNFEEAMVPFLIACLENNLTDLLGHVHKDKWDACKDAEGVAVVALEEYLSYILPDRDYSSLITKDEDGYYNVTLESAILPMCRDAIGYVMMQYVPVKDGSGSDWSVYNTAVQTYEQQVATGTDIFTLLNSVVVYYANTKGAGSLLGCVDTNGTCTITSANDLWTNFDIIVNKFMPVLGELQFGTTEKYGQFDSYDLIWNDIVSSVLDIGSTAGHDETNGGGITNFIYRLATIIGSPSISSKGIDLVVYDFVKDLLNALFNARYSNQHTYGTDVVPDALSSNPFHSVIQRDVIAGSSSDSNDVGVLGKAIANLAEFAGINGFPETIWDGAMFAVQAVSSFVGGFIPQLQDYEVGDLAVSSTKSAEASYNYGKSLEFSMTLENLGAGINRNVKAADGSWTQLDRSYIKIIGISSDKGSFQFGAYDSIIAPESDTTLAVNGSLSENDFKNEENETLDESIVTFTVTYQIVKSDGTPYDTVYNTTLTKNLYYYVTTVQDWHGLTYDGDSASGFTEALTPNTSESNTVKGTYSSVAPALWSGLSWFTRYYTSLQYPNEVVVRTSQLENLNYHVYLDVDNGGKSIDTIVASSEEFGGTDYFAVTCDPITGDLVNTFYYDYYQYEYIEKEVVGEDGQTYIVKEIQYDEEGNPLGNWITSNPLSRDAVLALIANDEMVINYRHHVVCDYENINTATLADGYVAGDHKEDKNEDGTFNCIYIPKDSGNNYKTLIDYSMTQPGDVTLSSGIAGIVLSFQKQSNVGSGDYQLDFLAWDQETDVQASSANMTYQIICGNVKSFTMPITVADDTGEVERVAADYIQALNILNNYTADDFTDQSIYNYFYDAAMGAIAAQEYPIFAENAFEYGSVKAQLAQYESTTNAIGDIAFKPVTSEVITQEIFNELRADTYEENGLYYLTRYEDTEGTAIYDNIVLSNEKVTDADVTSAGRQATFKLGDDQVTVDVYKITGTDIEVVKVKEPGVDASAEWHLLNDIQYVKEWKDAGSGSGLLLDNPYLTDSDVQATDAQGNPLYNEISFTYRNSSNGTVSSNDDWVIKLARTSYSVVDDYQLRGILAVFADKIEYALELIQDYIDVSYGTTVFQNVYLTRSGLNNANFEVVSYENMAAAGRAAEALIDVDVYYNYYLVDESGEQQLAFSGVASQAEDLLAQYNLTNSTSYELTDFISEAVIEQSEASSTSTTFELREAARLFNVYLASVMERGYIGDKLEEEISCAVNGKSGVDKDKKDTPYTSVSVDVDNASYAVNGTTYTADSNPDGVTYTADSWSAFIAALDSAVDAAVEGNTTYIHKDSGVYIPSDKDNYTLQVSDVYSIRKALMLAENGLTEETASAEGYTVSAYVGALAAPTDAYGTYATTGATVTIDTDAGQISAVTDESGKFVLENVPNGTYEATITYKYGFTRTFTIIVNGANVESDTMVGIVACDFNASGTVTVADFNIYNASVNTIAGDENYDLGIDLNRSNSITVSDYNIYSQFVNQTTGTITYTDTVIQ